MIDGVLFLLQDFLSVQSKYGKLSKKIRTLALLVYEDEVVIRLLGQLLIKVKATKFILLF